MGATDFRNELVGKDLKVEFQRAVEEALWEHGHGGYTGTIAEKDGYVYLGRLPARMTIDRLEQLIWQFEEWSYRNDEYNRNGGRRPGPNPVPEAWRSFIKKAYPIYRDKWGPAVVVELRDTEAAKVKARRGRKGTHDRVWVAMGLASL